MLPFTPISEQLLSAAWVAEEYPVLAPAAATAAPGWLGFIYMDHAVRRWKRVHRFLNPHVTPVPLNPPQSLRRAGWDACTELALP